MQDKYVFIHIDNLNIPELDVYRLYKENQLRRINEPDPGIFICESPKVIRRALSAGYEMISVLTAVDKPGEDERAVYEACVSEMEESEIEGSEREGKQTVPIYYGDDSLLRELAGYALTGGMFAAMRRKKHTDVNVLLKDKHIIAVLENIQNPTNIGAIFRSAAAMGIEAVVVTDDSSDPLYRRAERVSMGTVFQIPWTMIGKDEDYISILAKEGFKTVAMALSDEAVSISDPMIKKEEKLAIILGNEGYGLKEDTIKRSDYVAMIPMNPLVDSLNVAAASAVMFWEMTRK